MEVIPYKYGAKSIPFFPIMGGLEKNYLITIKSNNYNMLHDSKESKSRGFGMEYAM